MSRNNKKNLHAPEAQEKSGKGVVSALKKIHGKLKWIDPFTYVDLFLMPKINPSKNEWISTGVYLVSAFVFAWLIYTGLGFAFGTSSPMVIVVSGSMEPLYHRGDVIALFGANTQNTQAQEAELNLPTLQNIPFSEFAVPEYSQTSETTAGFILDKIKFNSGQEIKITKTGAIVVYFSELSQIPIIHRAIAKIHVQDGYYILTKGDSVNNPTIDQDCGKVSKTTSGNTVYVETEKPCITLYPVKIPALQGISVLQIPAIGCAKLWLFDDLFSLIAKGKLPPDFKGIC